ncbi:MAG: helix-turn-helix domain-containing protein [Castellaniella sp.]|nr:helix-turn-helix domain-containing protein [Castellaniella sp.]
MDKSIYTQEYSIFCRTLRLVREEAGLTQENVAAQLGATQTFISKCERGERRLDLVELRAWCDALGVDLTCFIQRFTAACAFISAQ